MKLFRRTQARISDLATEETVYWAYRLLLGREPDPAGFAHFTQLTNKGISVGELARHFEQSDEYRAKLEENRRAEIESSRPVAVSLGGYQVCLRRTERDFGRGIFDSGRYEEHVRQAVRDHLHEGDAVLDVGANIGVITLLAASIVGPDGRVFAVEPNPDNLQLLYRGVAVNRFANITIIPYAASDSIAIVSLTGGTSNTHLIPPDIPEAEAQFAQTVPLDMVIVGIDRLDFVKMDIEGYEPRALRGMQHLIERHRPTLLTEFNPRCLIDLHNQSPVDYLEQILQFYSKVRVLSAFADDAIFDTSASLMSYWEKRNAEVTREGLLPDRLLHFDLLATTHGRGTRG